MNFTEKEDYLIFEVLVVPRASKSEIIGEMNGALKIRIAAAPVGGAANTELIKLLSKSFEVPKKSVQIISGETSKLKIVKIYGASSQLLEFNKSDYEIN